MINDSWNPNKILQYSRSKTNSTESKQNSEIHVVIVLICKPRFIVVGTTAFCDTPEFRIGEIRRSGNDLNDQSLAVIISFGYFSYTWMQFKLKQHDCLCVVYNYLTSLVDLHSQLAPVYLQNRAMIRKPLASAQFFEEFPGPDLSSSFGPRWLLKK